MCARDEGLERQPPHRPNQLQVFGPDGDGIGFDDDDHSFDDYLDVGEFVDIKEAFGLPDSLPPSAAELAAAAREGRLLARAKQLGRWWVTSRDRSPAGR